MKQKDFTERVIELIKDDKELHDATVRLLNAMAARAEYMLQRKIDREKRIKKSVKALKAKRESEKR